MESHQHEISLTIDPLVPFKHLPIEMLSSLPPSSSVVRAGRRGDGEASHAAGVAVTALHARQDRRGTDVPAEGSPLRTLEPNCGCAFVGCQVLTSIRAVQGQAQDGLSSALLVVFLDSARNLPVSLLFLPIMLLSAHIYAKVVLQKILMRRR